jgi:hypothetical protein
MTLAGQKPRLEDGEKVRSRETSRVARALASASALFGGLPAGPAPELRLTPHEERFVDALVDRFVRRLVGSA